MPPPIAISASDCRRLALHAQCLIGRPFGSPVPAAGDPAGARTARRHTEIVVDVVRRLGAVQLDTISVLARSHELVPFSRVGAVGRQAVERAYWGVPHCCVEYWSHAASVIPVEAWPLYGWRRRMYADRHLAGRAGDPAFKAVRARLAEGPCTAEELGGARLGGPWWDWSPVKVAVERLLAAGEVVCVERRGWRRVYDLAERALPAATLRDLPDCEAHDGLLATAARRLGVGTLRDLADYARQPLVAARRALEAAALVPVAVEGWREPAWGDPVLLADLGAGRITGRGRPVLLSPFDSLVWERRRTERVFGFVHRLEAYTPADRREHGYFTMPLLAGNRLAGRVDPKRAGATLTARQLSVDAGAERAMAAALVEAAGWVGCTNVVLGTIVPEARRDRLLAELAALV